MAMQLVPRDYQEFACQSVFQFFRDHPGEDRHPIVAMPTGTGKSVVIARLLYLILSQWCTQRVLVLTHVKELIEQNHEKFITVWPEAPAGVFSAGLGRRDTRQNVIFGGIASVHKSKHIFGRFDLVFIDECHLVNPEDEGMYRDLFKYLTGLNPMLKIVGFTATPWRLGHGNLIENGIFTDICCDMTGIEAFNWLIAQGYLMPLVPKRTSTTLDVDGVHKRGGEFIASELQTAVDKEHITRAALNEAAELGADRNHWLIFAAGVDHACHIADMLNFEFNIPAIAIHGKMGKQARDDAIRDYKSGKYRVAVNNNVLTTGFDFPGIDLILMLRPTASAVLWVQMLGRGTRPFYAGGYDLSTLDGRLTAIAEGPKQNCLVLDFAGNTRRLGPINDPMVPKKKGEKGGTAPVKECPYCNRCDVHASARYCGGVPNTDHNFDPNRGCGYEFPIQTKLKQAASTAELIKGDAPVVEVFAVDQITLQPYTKGDTTMAKVVYYCGLKMFTEFVGIDHPAGNMRSKARQWLRDRGAKDMPETTDQLMALAGTLNAPTHLRVWVNQKYPSILAVCFDGTAWGKEENARPAPEVNVSSMPTKPRYPSRQLKQLEQDADIPFDVTDSRPKPNFDMMDDDIPF